ncbi:MAG: type II toxin-antitoxin system RelE/ParE family toxin [Thermoanaerobaculia bacterium]
MWNDRLRFTAAVREEWARLDGEARAEGRAALERLDDDPICGVPLFDPVRGYWSLRTSRLRIIYRISPEARTVFVLTIAAAGKEPA